MGPEPIEIPDTFTVAWYTQQKELKRNDDSIAAELLISKALLQKWKKRIGYVSGMTKSLSGRKKTINYQEVITLKKNGLSHNDIAEVVGIHIMSVQNIIKQSGMVTYKKYTDHRKKVIALREEGLSQPKIAKLLGIGQSSVNDILRDAGMTKKRKRA